MAKALEEFYRRKDRPLGRDYKCKTCCNARHTFPRKVKKTPAYKEKCRRWRMKHEYGLTVADYERMLIQQNGRCAICSTTDPGNGHGNRTRFAIDHDHKTNAVRGLLCSECNLGLGKFHDDPNVLQIAAEYIRRHGSH